MFERSGRTLAPAGMMWSVVMLSPTLSSTLPEMRLGQRLCSAAAA